MKIIIYQIDGKLPNLAIMRIAGHHIAQGHKVELRHGKNPEPLLWDTGSETVYASALFEKSRPIVDRLREAWPSAIIGGTGVDYKTRLEDYGITAAPDYSLYPDFRQSIGFSQRGCRLKCSFCVVPQKEGGMTPIGPISSIWRGDPHPREIVLLDNDFFGQRNWPDLIDELREGKFKVSFCQGINVRFITEKSAAALASVDYRNTAMNTRRLYTAWDSMVDEKKVQTGVECLIRNGIKPDHIMIYMLVGYEKNETEADRLHRASMIRSWGCRPYPMPYTRTKELVGFQRWIVRAYDKNYSWKEWKAANYRPEKLGAKAIKKAGAQDNG